MQREVLGEREVEHEAAALPVLRDVADAEVDDVSRARARHVAAGNADVAGDGVPEAAQRLDELRLAVPVHPGERDDLARVRLERDAADGLEPAVVEHV